MTYNAFLDHDDSNPRQVEMFPDVNPVADLIKWFVQHGAEFQRSLDQLERASVTTRRNQRSTH
jgi:hypothetical protein